REREVKLAGNGCGKLGLRRGTREREDLLPCLLQLIHRMIPFNYVVPGESQNDIITFRRVVEESPSLSKLAPLLQQDIGFEEDEGGRANEFSGPGYAMINFVADLPVRIDEHVIRVADPPFHHYGPIVFVMTEFQIVDVKTAQRNDQR